MPTGPVIQENLGKKAPARTLQDLLQNPHDEALFEHYTTAQIARVTLKGDVTPLGEPGVVRSMDPSPDGEYLLVQRVQKPFSYSLQESSFPRRIEIWDLAANEPRQLYDAVRRFTGLDQLEDDFTLLLLTYARAAQP